MAINDFLEQKLAKLLTTNQLRNLPLVMPNALDFSSNDYLGLARRGIKIPAPKIHGATGSRLLTGNTRELQNFEEWLADFHACEAALVFGSGYEANIGLISAVLDRESVLIYDALIHRSVRDACRIALGQALAFRHNDLTDLQQKLTRLHKIKSHIFVCVETIYSMDGDLCPLREIVEICAKFGANLIVDEAHSTGVFGIKGEGIVQSLGLSEQVFARLHTFGKALGLCGAAVLGSKTLKQFLVNKASSLIYTTALPSFLIQVIERAYQKNREASKERQQLQKLISHFQKLQIPFQHSQNSTPIQSIFIPNTQTLLQLSNYLQKHNLLLLPIRRPTVPQGQERLRLCLHAFNSTEELDYLCQILHNFGD